MAYLFEIRLSFSARKCIKGSVASENNFYLWNLNLSKNEYERSLLSEVYYITGSIF